MTVADVESPELGPVQVLVVAIPDANPDGSILAEMSRLHEAGIVRLVDLMIAQRDESGELSVMPGTFVDGSLVMSLLGIDEAEEMAASHGTWSLGEAIPPGGLAAVALIEHLWAAPLRDAIVNAGGLTLQDTWLATEDLIRLQNALRDAG